MGQFRQIQVSECTVLFSNYNMRQVNTELYRTALKPDLRAALYLYLTLVAEVQCTHVLQTPVPILYSSFVPSVITASVRTLILNNFNVLTLGTKDEYNINEYQ